MSKSIADIIAALPDGDGWGPPVTTETTLNGVPYAPFSKGDKLGRMADWTADGKDGRDGRGGRAQYNRNYRGTSWSHLKSDKAPPSNTQAQIKSMAQVPASSLLSISKEPTRRVLLPS